MTAKQEQSDGQEKKRAPRRIDADKALERANDIMQSSASSDKKWTQLIGAYGFEAARFAATLYQQTILHRQATQPQIGDAETANRAFDAALAARAGWEKAVKTGVPTTITSPSEIPSRNDALGSDIKTRIDQDEWGSYLSQIYKGNVDPIRDHAFLNYYLPPALPEDGKETEAMKVHRLRDRVQLYYDSRREGVLSRLSGQELETARAIYNAQDFNTLESHLLEAITANNPTLFRAALDRASEISTQQSFIVGNTDPNFARALLTISEGFIGAQYPYGDYSLTRNVDEKHIRAARRFIEDASPRRGNYIPIDTGTDYDLFVISRENAVSVELHPHDSSLDEVLRDAGKIKQTYPQTEETSENN